MATTSRRERILAALKSRLETILEANGFRTDVGQKVFLGEMPKWGSNDPDMVLAILPKEDQVQGQEQGGKLALLWPIDIGILMPADVDAPWTNVEAALMDVKRAIETDDDRDFGGLLRGGRGNPGGPVRGTTESYPRHSGSDVVGAVITYGFSYFESFGYPEN